MSADLIAISMRSTITLIHFCDVCAVRYLAVWSRDYEVKVMKYSSAFRVLCSFPLLLAAAAFLSAGRAAGELVGTLNPVVGSPSAITSSGTFTSPTRFIQFRSRHIWGPYVDGYDYLSPSCDGVEFAVEATCQVNGIEVPPERHTHELSVLNECVEVHSWQGVVADLGQPGPFTVEVSAFNAIGAGLKTINSWEIHTWSEPVQWPVADGGTGHWYQYVAEPDMWWNAHDVSTSLAWNGLESHLVTVTSAAEQSWLQATFPMATSAWIGAEQLPGSQEPGGGWRWVTGELFDYASWNTGEPNNTSGAENYAEFDGAGWNDNAANASKGYLVEYEPRPAGFDVLGTHGTSTYLLSRSSATWTEARDACTAAGGRLVVIGSQAEHEYIRGRLPVEFLWIGLQFTYVNGVGAWRWVDGEVSSYTHWAWSQPDGRPNETFACYWFDVDGWGDHFGDVRYQYICELDGNGAPHGLVLTDVPDDNGGYIALSWMDGFATLAGVPLEIEYYTIQRQDGADWVEAARVAPTGSTTQLAVVDCPGIQVVGEPAPVVNYRVGAKLAGSEQALFSDLVAGCSQDNLPPAAPQLALYDGEDFRTLAWTPAGAPDLGETCLYRGLTPGFEAGDPVACSTTLNFYVESHLARYYYRARTFDIHGNASEWSNEVIGRWPTPVPNAVPTTLRLYPCQPNPFNPRATIRYDVPAAGPVRLAVFDLAGRLLRTLVDESQAQGSFEAVWDGRDDRGRELGSGSYLARLEFGKQSAVTHLALVR